MKTLKQIVDELGSANAAYKFSVTGSGIVMLSVDGLMGSLKRMSAHG